jgi:hypothetical protein
VAIDRTSKFAFVELHEKATTRVAADFLRALIKAVPYRFIFNPIHQMPRLNKRLPSWGAPIVATPS